jgi:hypothetical protein
MSPTWRTFPMFDVRMPIQGFQKMMFEQDGTVISLEQRDVTILVVHRN